MDKKIVIYVQQTSNKELAIERYMLYTGSIHWKDILIQKSNNPVTANNSFINDKHALNYVFSELKCSFGPWENGRWFFSLVTDVVLNWSQPFLNAQLCFSVYICFLKLSTLRRVCDRAALQLICGVPLWFCCSEERVCVSGVLVCSWARGRT